MTRTSISPQATCRVRVERRDGTTRITDLDTGEPIHHATSIEMFQSGVGPMMAVIKIAAVVTEADIDCHAEKHEAK